MTTILAALDDDPVAARVLDTAKRIAAVVGGDVDVVHVRETPEAERAVRTRCGENVRCVDGDPATEIVRAARVPGVDVVVVGAQARALGSRTIGHIARAVLERADRPVVVVPPTTAFASTGLRRALLPLEGSELTSETVNAVAAVLDAGGVDLIPVHVFDVVTTPAFWDQTAHAPDSYAASFCSRWSPSPIPVRLRRGEAERAVVEAAREERVDLIVLGWAQDLTPGRARVVRAALRNAHVPVLLVPHPTAAPGRGGGA